MQFFVLLPSCMAASAKYTRRVLRVRARCYYQKLAAAKYARRVLVNGPMRPLLVWLLLCRTTSAKYARHLLRWRTDAVFVVHNFRGQARSVRSRVWPDAVFICGKCRVQVRFGVYLGCSSVHYVCAIQLYCKSSKRMRVGRWACPAKLFSNLSCAERVEDWTYGDSPTLCHGQYCYTPHRRYRRCLTD